MGLLELAARRSRPEHDDSASGGLLAMSQKKKP